MRWIALRGILHGAHARHAAWLALCLCTAGIVGGCTISNKSAPLEVRDDGRTAVSARSVWRIHPRRGHGVEIDYAQHRGSSTSFLGAGNNVMLDSAVINGPETLRNEATVRSYHVAYNYLIAPSAPIEAEAYVGLSRMDLKLRVQGNAPVAQISSNLGGSGVVIGIGPRWKLHEQMALEGRLTHMSGWSGDAHSQKDSIDVALAYRPVKQLTLRAGYSWLKAVVEHDTADSDVSARLRGPFLGMTLNF
jgi:hypothetical protein